MEISKSDSGMVFQDPDRKSRHQANALLRVSRSTPSVRPSRCDSASESSSPLAGLGARRLLTVNGRRRSAGPSPVCMVSRGGGNDPVLKEEEEEEEEVEEEGLRRTSLGTGWTSWVDLAARYSLANRDGLDSMGTENWSVCLPSPLMQISVVLDTPSPDSPRHHC